MKIPRNTKRYCPKCKKTTQQKVSQLKTKGRSITHPLSKGSTKRMKKRGLRRGAGNKGKYSKPPVAKWKRTGAKVSKKIVFKYVCQECKKATLEKSAIRMKKMEFE